MTEPRHYDAGNRCAICGEVWPCTTERDLLARRRKARVADRRHGEHHMVDPDYLRDRKR